MATRRIDPLVSVVVPVYNVERYIDECLDSIVGQSYKKIEIILVDDASPDGSGDKCDTWAKKDKRVKVIHKSTNQGLFQARITGFEAMRGEYFVIVDSDDCIDTGFVKRFLTSAYRNDADIVISNVFVPVDTKKTYGDVRTMPKIHATSKGFNGYVERLSKQAWGWCVWNKMYKTSVYKDARKYLLAVKGNINDAEDALFSLIFAYVAVRATYVGSSYVGYYHRLNSSSITKSKTEKSYIRNLTSIMAALKEMKIFIDKIGKSDLHNENLDAFKERLLSNYIWVIRNDYEQAMNKANRTIERDNYITEQAALITNLEKEISDLLSSKSYRVGRMIATPYIKLMELIKRAQRI